MVSQQLPQHIGQHLSSSDLIGILSIPYNKARMV
jgi:hypothetical protein